MIEQEFLFWVIVGTSLVSYGFGYFLWLFVYWCIPDRPEKRHAELRVKAINEYNKQQKEDLDKQWEENMVKTKESNRSMAEVLLYVQKKLTENIERQLLSSPAKTSGEPEKKEDDKLPPVRSADPYWAVVSPEGKTVCIKSAKIPYEVYKYYAEKIAKVSTLILDARGYRVQSYIPTSPPPPPSPLYNHLFHYERKPNA